jgi:MoaA/NifB/PqqE/SkfB family radical SAM enzyme
MVISPSQSRDGSTASRLERTFALGLGLTNECNLACSFCYRDPTRVDRLSLEQVRAVMQCLPVRSVNLGTGENGMHPDFQALVAYLRSEPIKLTITSNGYSIEALEDSQISAFQDVEFSLDYPTETEQDRQRGRGNWHLIHRQAARCRALGVSVTFIAVMMRSTIASRRSPKSPRHTTRLCASTSISQYVPTLLR